MKSTQLNFYLVFDTKTILKKEAIVKKEKKQEKKEIIVLDAGINMETIISGIVCCRGPLMPIRG